MLLDYVRKCKSQKIICCGRTAKLEVNKGKGCCGRWKVRAQKDTGNDKGG